MGFKRKKVSMPAVVVPTERKRGATRMRELGMQLVQIWLTPEERSLITRAATAECKTVARWARNRLVELARSLFDIQPVHNTPGTGASPDRSQGAGRKPARSTSSPIATMASINRKRSVKKPIDPKD